MKVVVKILDLCFLRKIRIRYTHRTRGEEGEREHAGKQDQLREGEEIRQYVQIVLEHVRQFSNGFLG